MERKLYDAAARGNTGDLKGALKKNPRLDANWSDDNKPGGWTSFHIACSKGHVDIVRILLAHPDIDVNQRKQDGATGFHCACSNGRQAVVRLLLRDSRVDINQGKTDGCTPLWWVITLGYHDILRWLAASGRDVDLGEPENDKTDTVGLARRKKRPQMVELLEEMRHSPVRVTKRIRADLVAAAASAGAQFDPKGKAAFLFIY